MPIKKSKRIKLCVNLIISYDYLGLIKTEAVQSIEHVKCISCHWTSLHNIYQQVSTIYVQ